MNSKELEITPERKRETYSLQQQAVEHVKMSTAADPAGPILLFSLGLMFLLSAYKFGPMLFIAGCIFIVGGHISDKLSPIKKNALLQFYLNEHGSHQNPNKRKS